MSHICIFNVSPQGLNDLYDFKLRHPDADLEPFLKRSSPFFQDYINKVMLHCSNQWKKGL